MKLAIIPGHGWKKRSGTMRWDPGATDDGVEEATVVRRVAAELASTGGERVGVFDSTKGSAGTYTERRKAAEAWIGAGPGIILHLHCNAGKGQYLMAMHDGRSSLGKSRAAQWCAAADTVLRPMFKANPDEKVVATNGNDWTKRGHSLLSSSYSSTPAGVCAVLIEVGFIDSDSHDGLWTEQGIKLQAQTILNAYRGV